VTYNRKNPLLEWVYCVSRLVFGMRTLRLMWLDFVRLWARVRSVGRRRLVAPSAQLHLGCGDRRVSGWLNVDVIGSECDVDLAKRLPWMNDSFFVVVGQHVVEHLELFGELLPLLSELQRVMRPGGEIWLSCPDMEKLCRLYLDGRIGELLEDRARRWPDYSLRGAPPQQFVNDLFYQEGEHKNLFDFGLLKWALERADFAEVKRVDESTLLARFPNFPARNDDCQSLYVRAFATPSRASGDEYRCEANGKVPLSTIDPDPGPSCSALSSAVGSGPSAAVAAPCPRRVYSPQGSRGDE
jgi:predicted SAM-dependent methyltransferase